MLTAVMLVSTLCVTAFAADDFDSAKLIDSGKKVSFETKYPKYAYEGKAGAKDGIPNIYKVKLSETGTLKLTVVSQTSSIFVQVLDKDGSEYIDYSEVDSTTGSVTHHHNGFAWIAWNKDLKKSKTTLEYNLEKGTYFVRVVGFPHATIDGKTSISFKYPQAEKTEEQAEITSFSITLEKGDKLQLGTILSGAGDVTWSSSKKSVASVSSKGKITAKKKGTAVITAKTGDSSMKITINVTE